jgi:periplasmic protein TonB
VLVLAVLGLLAAASPADTTVRVPGTTLRFGLDDTAISARGFTPAGPDTRKGRCRFFGLASDAILTVADGRLARADFTVSEASTYEIAYVHDQLTAMGYRKECGQPTPKVEACDWTARTRVHVEVSGTSLTASVVPVGAAPVAPPVVRATPPDAGYQTAQRVLGRLRGASAPAWATARDTIPHTAPAGGNPPAAPSGVLPLPSVPRDTVPHAAPSGGGPPAAPSGVLPLPPVTRDTAHVAAPAGGSPPAAPSGALPLPPVSRDTVRHAAPAGGPVPVLPETLAVSAPGRASRYARATLLGEPRCDYPEAARAAGIQGRVWVLALVGTDGRVIRAQLKSGIPVLNAAALGCVRDWSFKPVAWQGAPCSYWVLVPVTFTVH